MSSLRQLSRVIISFSSDFLKPKKARFGSQSLRGAGIHHALPIKGVVKLLNDLADRKSVSQSRTCTILVIYEHGLKYTCLLTVFTNIADSLLGVMYIRPLLRCSRAAWNRG